MADAEDTARQKVVALFRELTGERANHLAASRFNHEAKAALTAALAAADGPEPPEHAADIAFHLVDWGADAAFLVAMHLFPERFTAEEIRAGVRAFLIHAPNHIAAAAHLSGWPLRDVFGVGLAIDG